MRVTRQIGVVAALVTAGALLTACGGETAVGGNQAGEKPTELRLALAGEPDDGFDPTLGWGRYGSPLFQSTLLRRDADLRVEGDLATDWEVSEDGRTWTVQIRDDARFSDGEPLTADDVAFTFNAAGEQGGLTDVTALEEAVAVDDTTVELRLVRPRSTFVNRLVSLGIVPEHAYGDDYGQQPVGSGPFTFVDWQRGQQLVVERNDDYYGDAPAFERVVFSFADEDGALAAARAGEVQMAGLPSSFAVQEVEGMTWNVVESVDNRGIVFPMVPDTGETTEDGDPIGNDVTSDLALRRAVNVAIDREALVEGVLEGYGSPAVGPADATPWANTEAGISDADPETAAQMLADAGWVDADGDGVREKDGVRASFTLLYSADDSLRQGLSLAAADMVADIGVEVLTEGVSFDEIETRMHADPVLFGWGSHDPTEMFNLYHSGQAGRDYYNTGFYANDAVDGHLEAAMAATDEAGANEEWRAAQLDADGEGFTASADAAWAWLVNLEHTYLTDECLDVGDSQIEPHGHGWPITANITEWEWSC